MRSKDGRNSFHNGPKEFVHWFSCLLNPGWKLIYFTLLACDYITVTRPYNINDGTVDEPLTAFMGARGRGVGRCYYERWMFVRFVWCYWLQFCWGVHHGWKVSIVSLDI